MAKSEGKQFSIWQRNGTIASMAYTNGTLINEEIALRMAKVGNITPAIGRVTNETM